MGDRPVQAFVLAGGLGTRLRAAGFDVPKPLVPLAGRPVLFRQLDWLFANGIGDVTVLAGYEGALLSARVRDEFGDRVRVVVEKEPLGTGGCLALVRGLVRGPALVVSGDLVVDMDLAKLMGFHRSRGAFVTLTVHPNNHPRDSDLVEMDRRTGRVTGLRLRPHPPSMRYRNVVNASVAIVEPGFFDFVPEGVASNFEKDLVVRALAAGRPIFAYSTSEYVKDMGTPERLRQAETDWLRGVVAARSLRNPQRAVFFDRDGVLNVYRDLITRPEEIALEKGALDAVRAVNESPFLAILATNQPQVARNLVTFEALDAIHDALETQLGDGGAHLDAIFACPHHPDGGYPGENVALKIRCDCRKPAPGMLRQAAERFHLDLSQSFFVGDSTADFLAARRAGAMPLGVRTGLGGNDGKYEAAPDAMFDGVADAVRFALASSVPPPEASEIPATHAGVERSPAP
jgi:histidinol-phosphate phosphatase family protein